MTSADTPLVTRVRKRIAEHGGRATLGTVLDAVRATTSTQLSETSARQVASEVANQLTGAGPLAELLAHPAITDLLVTAGRVWIDKGDGLQQLDIDLGGEPAIRSLAQRLAAACGRRLDDAAPWVDARLPDGSRLHAVLPPIAADGVCLSVRTFRPRGFGLGDLVTTGTVTDVSARLVQAIVDAKLSYVVSGGTASGKTTLLSVLLGLVPAHERLVIVEDVTELRPAHPHVVSLQARTANTEGAGEIGLRQLVRQALRMRPDRIVVGECRGAELIELLSALNTGHDGCAGTVHANSPHDVIARLEALAALGQLPRAALHAQLSASLHCVLHMRRVEGRRALTEIGVFTHENGWARVLPAWRLDGGEAPGHSILAGFLDERGCARLTGGGL